MLMALPAVRFEFDSKKEIAVGYEWCVIYLYVLPYQTELVHMLSDPKQPPRVLSSVPFQPLCIDWWAYVQGQFVAEFGLDHLGSVLHAGELQIADMLTVLFLENTTDKAQYVK